MFIIYAEYNFAFCAAEDVLDFFRDSFIKWTDANTLLYELRHRKIISNGVLTEIQRNPDSKQQNEILHGWLTKSCDEEALGEVCDVMIAVDGNRRMNALGRNMKCKLEGKQIFEHLACVVCVRVCVCVCIWPTLTLSAFTVLFILQATKGAGCINR